jgi:cation transport regulator ChaC
MSGVWVFGYGSLVSPDSFGNTLGRRPQPGVDFFEAEVAGYGRRWNYGIIHSVGTAPDESGRLRSWTVVALGVVASATEAVNGIIAWVSNEELVGLDRRERYYDRVDVTSAVTVHGPADNTGRIVTYVPRREPRERYEQARRNGAAAVDQRYFDLVDRAFGDLGADRRERYYETTPAPDVPVLRMSRPDVQQRYHVPEPE